MVTVGPGPQRLAIEAGLLQSGAPFRVIQRGDRFYAEDGLTDLRLVTEGGRPVPHLLIHSSSPEREWIRGSVLGIAPTKKTSGVEVDLGAPAAVDMIRVEGLPSPHLKRLTLEGSGDRAHWTMLVAEGTLFDLPDELLRQNTLGFAAGPYRYFRITWNDANSGRVPNPAAVSARRVSIAAPPPAATLVAAIERRPSEPGISRYRVRLPGTRLPIVALDLDVGPGAAGGHVYRRAIVSESRFAGLEAAPVELGRAMLSRVVRDGITASALRVPTAVPAEAELELTIDDGANEPLELRQVAVVLAELPWIYFEAPAGAVTAQSGDRTLAKPQYDLEAVRSSVDLAKVPEARWGDGGTTRIGAQANSVSGLAPSPGAALDPAGFRHTPRHPAGARRRRHGHRSPRASARRPCAGAQPRCRRHGSRTSACSTAPTSRFPTCSSAGTSPSAVDVALVQASDSRAQELKMPPGSRQRSVYLVTLPYANLPAVVARARNVRPCVSAHGQDRRRSAARSSCAATRISTSGRWRRGGTPTSRPPPGRLRCRSGLCRRPSSCWWSMKETTRRLPLTKARLLLPSYRLRFFHAGGASLRMVYGRDDLQPPQYDLALLAPRVMGARAREVDAAPAGSARTIG